MLHNSYVNYCHFHFAVYFCAICFMCLLKLYSHVGELKKRLIAVDKIK